MLKTYRYKGGDNGFLWRIFYNPAAKKMVDFLPRRLAPNVITLLGFFFSVLPFVLLFSLCGTSMKNEPGKPIPRWFYLVEAFSYFFYRMLDEMDGKQARRTGNSSPLGLLFDHGLDSFTMGFQAMIVTKCIQIGNNMKAIFAVGLPCASFYFSTLEEYYTGGLFLGPGNGVTDGSVAVIGINVVMFFIGNDFWAEPLGDSGMLKEFTYSDVMFYTILSIQICTFIMCIKGVFDH